MRRFVLISTFSIVLVTFSCQRPKEISCNESIHHTKEAFLSVFEDHKTEIYNVFEISKKFKFIDGINMVDSTIIISRYLNLDESELFEVKNLDDKKLDSLYKLESISKDTIQKIIDILQAINCNKLEMFNSRLDNNNEISMVLYYAKRPCPKSLNNPLFRFEIFNKVLKKETIIYFKEHQEKWGNGGVLNENTLWYMYS